MNTKLLLVMFLLASMAVASLVHADIWNLTGTVNYGDFINYTVLNWNYTSPTVNTKAYDVLIAANIPNTGGIAKFVGWSANNGLLGNVSAFLIAQNGTHLVYLVSNETVNGNSWSKLTLFGNTLNSHALSTVKSATIVTPFKSDLFQLFSFVNYTTTYISNYWNTTPYYAPTNTVMFNFSGSFFFTTRLNPVTTVDPFVILSNTNLTKRQFNISWNPYLTNTYRIGSYNSIYSLSSLGLACVLNPSCGFVTGSQINSIHANTVFINNTRGGGFESWFDVLGSNQLAGEGMGVGGSRVFNNSASSNVRLNLNNKAQFVSINVSGFFTNFGTIFDIMPSFTSNYIVSNTISNNAVTYQLIGNCTGQPFPINTFAYESNQTINWTSNFTTYADPSNLGNAVTLQFNYTLTKWAVINMPNYFGDACVNMYLQGESGNSSLGEIPYYVLNCSLARTSFLIPDNTLLGDTYNNFFIYAQPRLHISGFNNGTILNQWLIVRGTGIINISRTQLPYVVTLTNPLNPTSYFNITNFEYGACGDISCYFALAFNATQNSYRTIQRTPGNGGSYMPDYTGLRTTSFISVEMPLAVSGIYDGVTYSGIAAEEWLSKNLDIFTNGAYQVWPIERALFSNTTAAFYFDGHPLLYGEDATLNLTNGNIGSVYHLYRTLNYSAAYFTGTGNCGFKNETAPPLPVQVTVPSTTSNVPYTNSTTINIANALTSNTMIGDTGIAVPTIYLLGLEIILFLLAITAMFYEEGFVIGIAILVIMWLVGVFQYGNGSHQLLPIAIIATIVAITEHFVMEHRHPRRKQKGEMDGQ